MEIDIQRFIRQMEQANGYAIAKKIEYKYKGKDYVIVITIKHKEDGEHE